MSKDPFLVKANVDRFDEDVRQGGGYVYTGGRLSSRLANARISKAISDIYPFSSKRVLDLGCGDGAYSFDFVDLGAAEVVGIDPAKAAVDLANLRAEKLRVADRARFQVGNIYDAALVHGQPAFDCVVLRGVLHHLPDPRRAVACASALAPSLIILEPNGLNPVLKMLERYSSYHVEHEEQSFSASTIAGWIEAAGMDVKSTTYLNLVPMFCPDWFARVCKVFERPVELVPLLRTVACGQSLIFAQSA